MVSEVLINRINQALRRASLVAAITPIPDVEGAACACRSDLFDPASPHSADRAHSEARALAICARCPVLGACRAWFASLPAAQRPVGVIAGCVHSLYVSLSSLYQMGHRPFRTRPLMQRFLRG